MAEPAFVGKLTPPAQFGYVASSFSLNKDARAPRLIVLSDLHAHVEVQHNLIGIMHDLLGKLSLAPGKRVPVFVEGGWEKHLEEPLHTVANHKTRAFLSEYLMQKAQIGSAQAFSEEIAGSGKVQLIGVEDKATYEGNRKQFLKTYPGRKRLLTALAREERALRQLSKYVANGSFEKLQSMRDSYNAGRVGAARYARMLSRYVDRSQISGHFVDVLRNSSQARPDELEVALNQVYREVALKLSKRAPWTSFLRQSLGNEEMMRQNIARFDSDFDLLKRLVADQLTPGEVPLVIARMPYLKTMTDMLIGKSLNGMDDKKVVEESVDFYPYAFLRDGILAKNSLKELDAMKDAEATGILVVGGFHTDAILDYLQKNGISYLHINPTVSRDMTTDEQLNYVKRMGEEPVSAEELKNDLVVLSKGGHAALRGSAIGAIADNQSPQTSTMPGLSGKTTSNMGGGGLLTALAGLDPSKELDVLRSQGLSRLGVEADAAVYADGLAGIDALARVAPEGSVEKARLDNLATKINAAVLERDEITGELKNRALPEIQLLPGDFTVVREGDRYVPEDQKQTLDPHQLAILGRINSEPFAEDAPQRVDVFMATDRSAKAMSGEELVLHAQGEQRTAIVFTESRVAEGVRQPGTTLEENVPFFQAIHSQKHGIAHAVGKASHFEARAAWAGIFGGAKIAAATFTEVPAETAVLAFLDAIVPQMSLYQGQYADFANMFKDKAFRVALANQIAGLLQGPDLTDEQIKKIAENLKKDYPDVPDYVIAQSLNATINSIVSRMATSDLNGPELQNALEAKAKELFSKAFADLTVAQQAVVKAA